MKNISWCKKQKKGIELVEPNDNLCVAYFKDADESLLIMTNISGKWKIVTGYYACYNAFYALLMKVGIKCEIHDCTLYLMPYFNFNEQQVSFLEKLKKLRIDVQYYLEPAVEIDVNKIKEFITSCKSFNNKLDEDEIDKIRGLVKND